MASRKNIQMDGESYSVPSNAKIVDVVPEEATSVVTHSGEVIPRQNFNRPVPDGFEMNLSHINKG